MRKNFIRNLGNRNRARPIYTPILSLTTLKTLHLTPVCAILMTTYNEDTVFEELDSAISEKEILDSIDRLKRDKSHGIDLLINEYFINFKEDTVYS